MKQTLYAAGLALLFGAGLSACTEAPQTAGPKSDARASAGPGTAYSAAGWKPGDAASWDQQLRVRSQSQNEYTRTGAH
ncbi:conserved exported hypothetical protein [Rubrivivax sp. A210]|uniref:hypothetical protein n=1 Tax=Rubrivivax sp. A210 TaxID=2772301 RepID=UPI00191A5F0D|nr:hypothetical protein [Rubrivivax sp. A210]CAD5373808.1 conserved exported hypothetical protein [Rubrivivax sp. A210]